MNSLRVVYYVGILSCSDLTKCPLDLVLKVKLLGLELF